jgi:hypothetical protein
MKRSSGECKACQTFSLDAWQWKTEEQVLRTGNRPPFLKRHPGSGKCHEILILKGNQSIIS